MDFGLSEERQMLADTLAKYFEREYPLDRRNKAVAGPDGFDTATWAELADLGIHAALLPPQAGGFGGEGFDIALVFEELGKVLAPEPFLESMVVAAGALLVGGSADHQNLLDAMAAGTSRLTFAFHEAGGRYDPHAIATTATQDGDKWTLSGSKAMVRHGVGADAFVVSAMAEASETLFLVPADAPGLTLTDHATIDAGHACQVTLDGVTLAPDTVVGSVGQGAAIVDAALARGIVAISAEALGIMERIKTLTIDFLRTRKQFGVPIGRFQALQHRMADVLLEIEQTRSAVINAADALGRDPLARDMAVSAAKYTVGKTGALVAQEAIQMHGGIGMTAEYDLSAYAKRLILIDHALGDQDWHLMRFASLSAA